MTRIVVNGTFDILHRGHIELLNYAKSLGEYLLVCIDSDALVSYKKGQHRPINNQWERMLLLKNLKAVDDVKIFNSDKELEEQLCDYRPDIMVKGSDYRNKPIVGAEFCNEINFFERLHEYSTTKTIQDIVDRG
jgi:D-beta-D-heptose 7-phosphate kinase/D-beta-D-heptose 1-phosphate adenosyltransferase